MTQADVDKMIIVGVFNNQADAQKAVAQLRTQGFSSNDVQTVAEQDTDKDEPGEVQAKNVTNTRNGTFIGVGIGGVIGAVIGFLFGNNILPLPQSALVATLGPVTMTLIGIFIGVALGILAGSMSGLSVARQETKGLEKTVEAGNWLVTVQNSDPAAARAALQKVGAVGIKSQTPTHAPVKQKT